MLNWDITGNTASFTLFGTIDAGVMIGPNSDDNLDVGVPGATDWVTGSGISRTIVNIGGSRSLAPGVGGYFSSTDSDYIFVSSSDSNPWKIGDSLHATVEISGGTLDGSQFTINSGIVTAGRMTADLVDPTYQVGTVSAVPEPSSYAFLLALLTLGVAACRRRKS